MNNLIILFSLIVISFDSNSQNMDPMTPSADSTDYYYEIPAYPDNYSAENVAARMVDGLGFRFYWASEGLRQSDLDYKPSKDGRTTAETIDHVYGLSLTIINAATSTINESVDRSEMTTEDKRRLALENIKSASEYLKKSSQGDMESMKSIFKREEGPNFELPFWNMVNGPIADAIWHSGQIVTFRRSSGNPVNSNLTFFQGRLRN